VQAFDAFVATRLVAFSSCLSADAPDAFGVGVALSSPLEVGMSPLL